MPSHRSRRWKSGSMPASFWASSQTSDWMPATGFQWNFTSDVSPAALTSRKVWTPKPSIVRNDRGMARSRHDPHHMWVDSGCRETKSQKVSCADWACGISRSGSRLDGVDEVRELDAVLDEEHRHVVADQVAVALVGVELDREAADVARPCRPSRGSRAPWRTGRTPAFRCRSHAGSRPAWTSRQSLVGLEEAVGRRRRGRGPPARGSARGRNG